MTMCKSFFRMMFSFWVYSYLEQNKRKPIGTTYKPVEVGSKGPPFWGPAIPVKKQWKVKFNGDYSQANVINLVVNVYIPRYDISQIIFKQ